MTAMHKGAIQEEGWMRRICKAVVLAVTSALCAACLVSCARARQPKPGVVHLSNGADFSTMDVAETTNDYLVPMNIFDRLFETRRIDGKAEVVNSLCCSYTMADDAQHFDFVLRDGVVFSNGSPLTASDVKYSFERLLSIARQNTEIPLEVVGGQDMLDGNASELVGIVVQDDTHFSIDLEQPNAGFIAELSSPAMSIVDAESCQKAEYFGHEPSDTIGSGPYVIDEWVTNDHFTLRYNERYWGEAPSVREAIFHIVPDKGTQNLMFQNGELDLIDITALSGSIVKTDYKQDRSDQLVSGPEAALDYFALNEHNQFLSDVRVRRAIAYAIDIDSIVNNIFYGDAIPQHGIIPTGVWGANDKLTGYPYDPDAARALLAEAGYGDGEVTFELSLAEPNDKVRLMCEAIVSDLSKVGIDAHIKVYDSAAWVEKRLAGELESFVAMWYVDFNDPASIMATFFGNAERTARRSMFYPDTEVMAQVSAAPSIADDDERAATYQRLEEKIAIEDVAWVPLVQERRLFCKGDRVADFTPHWAGYGDSFVSDIHLTDAASVPAEG